LAAAVELAPNPSAPGKKAYEVFLDCLAHGVLVRSAGDNLVLAPAYVVTPAQIAQMVDTLAAAIKRQA
jgi:beta-alanine--pyruvate transaminase